MVQNKCIVVPLSFIRYVVRIVLVAKPETNGVYFRWIAIAFVLIEVPVLGVRDCLIISESDIKAVSKSYIQLIFECVCQVTEHFT
jgi:hypothetical protein